jgi:hypothetical protein
MRKLLKALWDSSYADTAVMQNRRERQGWVYQDNFTGEYQYRDQVSPTDQVCKTGGSPNPPLPPNTSVIMHAHVHPFAGGEPTACNPQKPSVTGTYDDQKFGGPSSVDYSSAASYAGNGAIASVVMDARWLYRISPGANSLNWNQPGMLNKKPRYVLGQCSRP